MTDCATKDDLLGADDAATKPAYANLTNIFSTKPHTRSRATVFSLGGRESLISIDFLSPLIVPSTAQQAGELVSLKFLISNHTQNFSINSNKSFAP